MASSVRVMSIVSLLATVVSETALAFFSLSCFLPSCCRYRGFVLFSLPGPRLENVVILIRPSINDYMQVLCYIAT